MIELKSINNGIFVFFFSFIYSLIEIEIEGKDGWCKNLPTAKNVFFNFTLYHILMMCIITLTFYKIFNKKDIWILIFYITMFFYIEDYLWFIYNPFYTYKKYSKEFIPWHKHWFLGQPIENYICYFIILMTYFKTKFKTEQMNSSIYIVLLLSIFTLLSPLYHIFYFKIRQ